MSKDSEALHAMAAVADLAAASTKTRETIIGLKRMTSSSESHLCRIERNLQSSETVLLCIRQWLESDSDDLDAEILSVAVLSVVCCRLLVTRVNAELSKLKCSEIGPMKVRSLEHRMRHLLRMTGKQYDAFSDLAIACNDDR